MKKKLEDAEIEKMAGIWLQILDCFERCQSLEHLCVLLDVCKLSRPKKIGIGFLHWIEMMATSPCKWLGPEYWSLSYHGQQTFMAKHPQAKKMEQALKRMSSVWSKKLRRMLLSYAKKHIDELVGEHLALRWIETRAFAKRGKQSGMSEMKDTLLYYWMKKHHGDLGTYQRQAR